MTRINVVPPHTLCDQHLIAEYRELPRVFGLTPLQQQSVPETYRMGTGHVRFFYNKLKYLYKRQKEIVLEMHRRGFKTSYTLKDLGHVPEWAWNDWEPTEEAVAINQQRIDERLSTMKNPRWSNKDG